MSRLGSSIDESPTISDDHVVRGPESPSTSSLSTLLIGCFLTLAAMAAAAALDGRRRVRPSSIGAGTLCVRAEWPTCDDVT